MQAIQQYKLDAFSRYPARNHAETKSAESPFLPMTVLFRTAIVATYSVILLTIVLNVEISSKSPVFVFLCLALVLNFSVTLLPIFFYKPSYGWFHPLVFECCMYLLFQLRSFATYLTGLSSHRALPTWSPEEILMLVVYVLTLKSIATAAYYFGFFFGPGFSLPRLSFPAPHNVAVKATAVVIFAVIVFYFYIQMRGGLEAHLMSWREGRHDSMAGEGYWHFLIKFAEVAVLLWFTMDRKAYYQPLFWICALTSIYINFVATGSRSGAVFALIAGLLVWMLRERKVSLPKMVVVGFVAVVMLGLLGNYREQVWRGDTSLSTTNDATSLSQNFGEGAAESGDRAWSGNALLPIVALVPDKVDMLYGSSYLSVLTLPIPRSLWAGKPGMVGGLAGETFFHSPAGVPPGSVGEAYWNFHIPGVILVFFIWGTFHKWLAEVYLKYAAMPAMILIYLTIIFVFEPSTPSFIAGMLLLVPAIGIMRLIGAIRFR